MRYVNHRLPVAALATVSLVLAACGSDDSAADSSSESAESDVSTDEPAAADEPADADEPAAAVSEVPTIVVTTNILGDVVEEMLGGAAEVITIMPVGADPHVFEASAQEINSMMNADALITNGGSFEEGLLDVIENAEGEGVPTFEALSVIDALEYGEGGHSHEGHSDEGHSDEGHSDEGHSDEDHSDEDHSDEDHSDEGHSDEGHSDEHQGHDHSGVDPHFFNDPARMAVAVRGISNFLQSQVTFADADAISASADAYIEALTDLDVEVAALVELIPEANRVLVTNHEVFAYFADRYGFEVAGAIIPSGSTADSASAGELAELAELIEAEGVPAIFTDVSSPDQLAQTLADEVGEIAIVELFTESLGDADSDGATYIDMVRTNAERISAALA